MRELDASEIRMLWDLYETTGSRGAFVVAADHKIGDVSVIILRAVWEAFDCARDHIIEAIN